MKIAQLRSKIRGSLKIIWSIGWVESIPRLGVGYFDFVSCTGVLHHLKDPQRGINILHKAQLRNGGAMFMVYGQYGRSGVYQIQTLLKLIFPRHLAIDKELNHTKVVLSKLPPDHLFRHVVFKDLTQYGDIGIYDLLLHKRDVSYTIPSVYEWTEKGSYTFVDHCTSDISMHLSLNALIGEKLIFNALTRMPIYKQQATAEIISGNIYQHMFYASKRRDSKAMPVSNKYVIYAYGSPLRFTHVINKMENQRNHRDKMFIFAKLAWTQVTETALSDQAYNTNRPGFIVDILWPYSELNNFVIRVLTRKPTMPKTLISLIHDYNTYSNSNITISEGLVLLNDLFMHLKDTGMFYAKHQTIPEFPFTCSSNHYTVYDYDTPVEYE